MICSVCGKAVTLPTEASGTFAMAYCEHCKVWVVAVPEVAG